MGDAALVGIDEVERKLDDFVGTMGEEAVARPAQDGRTKVEDRASKADLLSP